MIPHQHNISKPQKDSIQLTEHLISIKLNRGIKNNVDNESYKREQSRIG